MRHVLCLALLLVASITRGDNTIQLLEETSVWNHGSEDEPPTALDRYLKKRWRNDMGGRHEDLAEDIALVSTNEGALWNLRTATLVHQVVVTNAQPWQDGELPDRVIERQIEFLAKHSGKVLGRKPCPKTGNCKWVRNLSKKHPERLPANIASGDAGPKDWAKYWKAILAPKWERVMRFSRALVANDMVGPPCPIPPRSWGSLKEHMPDVRVAAGNGLYPIGCEGTGKNDGFAPLSRFPFWHMKDMDVEW